MSDTILAIEDLRAGYGGAPVVRDLSIEIQAGEVVGLLGPNGAGKTTTLRAISGLVRPMSGTISFLGEDLTSVHPSQRGRIGISHVPEGRGLFFGLTVAEHFKLGYPGERLDAEEAYGHFPALADLKNRKTGLLSGGEQQMLAVARGLVRNPKLLLLDELSLGLAPVIVERILPVIRNYAKQRDCGVLLVEQHVHLALEAADRCYVLSHGEITLSAEAATLRANPDMITASYMGETLLATGGD